MASPLSQAGAISPQTKYAALHTNRFMTGLWTNRNQLRDAATPFLYEKFYSASRYDSLIGGSNCELTPAMTMKRRAGFSVYNSQTFPPINRFSSFRSFSTTDEKIRVMADTAGAVYDATGPSTKLNIWNKSAGAGDTTFQSVGNNLFFGNGLDQKKWVQALPEWTASTLFATGKIVVDSNNNLQAAVGGITVGVDAVQIAGNVLTITLDPNEGLPTNLMALVGLPLTFSGLTGAAFLNGQTVTIATVTQGQPAYTSNVFTAAFTHADYGPSFEEGLATSGNGTTGTIQPLWAITNGAYTADAGQIWICKGSSVQNWGIAAPANVPSVVQSALPTTYPAWSKSTYYSTCYLIYNAAGFIQMATTFGTTGSSEPIWNNATSGTTADGTVVWTCIGSASYASGTAYAAGAYVTRANTSGTLYFFKVVTAGITAATPPTFTSPLGSQVIDGTVTWANVGRAMQWSAVTASSITSNFGIIPLQGGGSMVFGVGQGAANGTSIALPTGYSSSNMVSWSSPGAGFSGTSTVTEGVFQSTSAGGVLNSSFQGNFGGSAFAATSNWAAAAWSAGAAVTLTTVGGLQYVNFTTLAGDQMVICVGQLANGGTIAVPSGFLASQFLNIAGMSGSDNPGHIMQGVQTCSLSAGLVLTTLYNDNSGSTWTGPANIFGVFYNTSATLTTQFVTGGKAILIQTQPGASLALIQAFANDAGSFGLPAGFASSVVQSTAAMAGWTASGGNHGHGYSVSTTGMVISAFYQDGSGHTWSGGANVFAIAAILNTTSVSPAQTIVDANGELEAIAISGVAGAVAPAWSILQGALTTDNAATWRNTGLTTAARTLPSQWAFSFKSSATKHVSTASPQSAKVTLDANNYAFLQGDGSADSQVDTIVIYRYAQGGATLLYLDEIPAPPAGQMWQYRDQLPDSFLNSLIPAPIAHANDPPPVGFRPLAYHLSRVFGAVGNTLSWTNGTNQIGDPNQSFQPSNFFTFPAKIVNAWACTLGLIVYTVSEPYIVLGSGTNADPLYAKKFMEGLGLLSYDAFTCNKTTPYLMNTTKLVMALDPSAGVVEPGFPIADQFDALYDPSTAQVTWHEGAHGDTALYVGNPSTGSWFRMGALSAPENGQVWSAMGTIAAGFSCMSSMETAPGQKLLLLGPKVSGPILFRDPTVNTDNGVTFPWFPIIGSIVLAQPGQVAELAFFTLESRRVGTRPTMGVLLGEIDGPITGTFDTLRMTRQDPTLLKQSKTLYNDRYAMMQNQQTALCRHLQIRIDYLAEDAANELLTYTIFGALKTTK